jgi:hypothetical protein
LDLVVRPELKVLVDPQVRQVLKVRKVILVLKVLEDHKVVVQWRVLREQLVLKVLEDP